MTIKIGTAPVSWGIMEIDGWGEQQSYSSVLDEMQRARIALGVERMIEARRTLALVAQGLETLAQIRKRAAAEHEIFGLVGAILALPAACIGAVLAGHFTRSYLRSRFYRRPA